MYVKSNGVPVEQHEQLWARKIGSHLLESAAPFPGLEHIDLTTSLLIYKYIIGHQRYIPDTAEQKRKSIKHVTEISNISFANHRLAFWNALEHKPSPQGPKILYHNVNFWYTLRKGPSTLSLPRLHILVETHKPIAFSTYILEGRHGRSRASRLLGDRRD